MAAFKFAIALLCVAAACVIFAIYVFDTIHQRYRQQLRDILYSAEEWKVDELEERLSSGDIILVMTPVHYAHPVTHVATALRHDENGPLTILDVRLRKGLDRRALSHMSLRYFIKTYCQKSPCRIVIRRFRESRVDGSVAPLDGRKLKECAKGMASGSYALSVAPMQVNTWISRLGCGFLPLVPQTPVNETWYCSSAPLEILARYGVLAPEMRTELNMMAPGEWMLPASGSARRFPLMQNVQPGFVTLPLVQVNLERGLRPRNFFEMREARRKLTLEAEDKIMRAQREFIDHPNIKLH